jgi:hypothetical protein
MTKIEQSNFPRRRSIRVAQTTRWLGASLALTCFASSAYALIISDDVFTKNGGNLANIPGTIATAMEPLRRASYSAQFMAVGRISGCTATWLGDTPNGASSVLLTAAHCVEGSGGGVINQTFSDWKERTIASGVGTYVLGPYRSPIPSGMGGASTDIAIVTLPKKAQLVDEAGKAVPQPVIYDGDDELNQQVWFAGYGSWGTGIGESNGGYFPVAGPRRAAGPSTINSFFESNFGIGAGFSSSVGGDFSTRMASGDSGAAWWQRHDGDWSIIATTNGHGTGYSTGARVSKYADWIRSVYPDAKFASDRYTVTSSQGVTTPNFALDAQLGTVAYVVPSQANAIGPTALVWGGTYHPAMVTVTVKDKSQNRSASIQLRALRDTGCGLGYAQEMNAAVSCYSNRSGPLIVTYNAADNPGLAAGTYVGTFNVEARGWHDPSYVNPFQIKVNVTVK